MDIKALPIPEQARDYYNITHDDIAIASWKRLLEIANTGAWYAFVWPDEEEELHSGELEPLLVDKLTAQAFIAVHNALNDKNKAKLEEQVAKGRAYFGRMVDFCWERVKIKR